MRVTPPDRDLRPDHRQPSTGRRGAIALLVAACVAAGVAIVFGPDLLLGGEDEPAEPARPLSAEEATRLASMRQHNWQDARAGVRATIGEEPQQVRVAGWVDWQRPMVYLAVSGPQPGVVRELVQAIPGLVATRPGPLDSSDGEDGPAASASPATADPHPQPPVEPPVDGWQLRRPGEDGPAGTPDSPGSIDSLAVLLLMITAEQPDAAQLLADSESQWLRRDRTAGYEVDVLLGPAVPPSPSPASTAHTPESHTDPPATGAPPTEPAPSEHSPADPPPQERSLAAMGGAVQYWLDGQARLHRLEALLAATTPARVDLDREDRTRPGVLDLLGGSAIDPRPVTDREIELLTELPRQNLAAAGGAIELVVPEKEHTVRATGWLDWRRTTAYLARYEGGEPDGLLWADSGGVSTRAGDPEPEGGPPVPAPQDEGWRWSPWEGRGDGQGGFDVDLLLNEVLSLGGGLPEDPEQLRETAAWLREDDVSGTPVSVFEIPRSVEAEVKPGEARMRYWVDDEAGVLRRLEIRTRAGGFGQLDLDPGPVPPLD